MDKKKMLPLAGVRVLDLGAVLMAPYACQWLADFGADVIKVEAPAGDTTRYTGPATEPGMAAVYLGINRNKRAIVLDLQNPEGRTVLETLIAGADILVHNIRPQKLAKLDLLPEEVLKRHPRLVYAVLNGFDEAGPYAGQPAYDDIIQGLCGNVDLVERQTGVPRYLPMVSADKTTGIVAAMAIIAAYAARQKTGAGCTVEIPMFETQVGYNMIEHLYGASFVPPIGGTGYPRPLARTRGPYRTRDGLISMMPYNDQHWLEFFGLFPEKKLNEDPRFGDIGARTRHIAELYQVLADVLPEKTTAEWLALCGELGIPAGPVLSLDEVMEDPHLRATGFFQELHDPGLGELRMPGAPVRFNGERAPARIPPRLGEHTRAVLVEAGYSDAEIDALVSAGVVREASPRAAAAAAQ
jgi:crotonobetainyl-CoA:carnitine CoA-transferase CaiB-like acyl-CoA transferase